MCELLGMSANVPTDICFSFAGLMQRGGGTGPHKDGWGIAFYEGKGVRCFHDPNPSVNSKIASLVKEHPIKSHVVISHIRQANVGDICLENTHPFQRELWGFTWTFAHNGQLDKSLFSLPLSYYHPVGTTDSEYAFCWLLGELRTRFPKKPDDFSEVSAFIHTCCERLRELGVFNMLLTESTHLFAFCGSKLSWITRKAPFGEASLTDCDVTVDFVQETKPGDIVTVIATVPLTANEEWVALEPGELVTFVKGLVQ
ncbi:class II glutamine amidotransferase [Neptuniibacter sp. 2_MG-2023]|jgi:glutamine amidotransferase|uniref:class II glutamine amidotransferase n=1 Tax=Neptuniibacter sp. 2_MG-2023 TaxID=3062671 RepID=UPI0026E389C2|nr:class II glutamine amidotransferase [Neptuniibacter sp. 2_MG-2023]MDO6513691.1 class II glutamine amidotransferase [Neptuniibacter sp. 2_MG-2023]